MATEMALLQPTGQLTQQNKSEVMAVQQVHECGKQVHFQGVLVANACLFLMWKENTRRPTQKTISCHH